MSCAELKVQLFIARLKSAAQRPGGILFVDRKKNLEALERFNLNQSLVLHMVSRLTPTQYKSGPEADFDGSEGTIWIFSSPVEGREFYVKLKLITVNGLDYIKIISFHD